MNELTKLGIENVIPGKEEQDKIDEIIYRINRNNSTIDDKKILLKIIEGMGERGAERVLLACTDLQQIVLPEDTSVPLLDSFAILENAVFDFLMKD
ncbi:MAG: aspartate/glutamate racemase family protein [Nanoarchaeota archaeon]